MQRRGVHFLDIIDLKYDSATMSPTIFYDAYREHFVDNLRKVGDVVAWKSANPIFEDEEMSYLLEDTILLMTISLIDQRLLPHIREVYRHRLGVNSCLRDFKSDILNSIIKMISDIGNKEDLTNNVAHKENNNVLHGQKVNKADCDSNSIVQDMSNFIDEGSLIKIETEESVDQISVTHLNKTCNNELKTKPISLQIEEEFVIAEDGFTTQEKDYFKVPCKECNKLFHKKSLNKHMRNIHGKNKKIKVKNMCKKCGLVFETYKDKYRHAKVVHGGIVIRPRLTDKEVQDIKKTGNRLCTKCGIEFPYVTHADKAYFKRHTRNNLGVSQSLACNGIQRQEIKLCNCKRPFKSKAAKSRHIKIEHLGYISCPKCSNCIQAQRLEAHIKTHDNTIIGKEYVCEHCGKTLKNITRLRYHIQNYHPKAPSTCEVCHQSFQKRYELDKHRENVHQEIAQCDMCAKTFVCRSKLLIHLKLVHSEEEDKQHQCDQCEKKFVQECQLRKHQVNVHFKTRPYACRYKCGGMAYNDSSNRNSHEKRKHGAVFTKRLVTSPLDENTNPPLNGVIT